jgi:hypothetical protein
MLQKIKKVSSLFFCLMTITSCVEELDFTQLDDYRATPVFTTSAVYFTIFPYQFFDRSGVQINEIEEATDIDIPTNNFLRRKTVRIDFNAQISNELEADFILQIQLLDADYTPIYETKEMLVKANDLTYEFNETFDLRSNPELKEIKGSRLKIKNNTPSVKLNPKDNTKLQFTSSYDIYLDTNA